MKVKCIDNHLYEHILKVGEVYEAELKKKYLHIELEGTNTELWCIERFEEVKEDNGMKKKSHEKVQSSMLRKLGISRVIFNEGATIVFLDDGSKGVAKCSMDDHFDPVVGISVAYTIAKATAGNKKKFKTNIQKIVKKYLID